METSPAPAERQQRLRRQASWGHRSGGGPGQDSELFFGYYASAGTMMRDQHGPPAPELARRMTVCSCRHDPARTLVPVLTAMPAVGIPLGDILADSGHAHHNGPSRSGSPAASWSRTCTPPTADPAAPTPAPSSPTATSTARSPPLLELGPLARDATPEQAATHDSQAAELGRHKLGKITRDDTDGYQAFDQDQRA